MKSASREEIKILASMFQSMPFLRNYLRRYLPKSILNLRHFFYAWYGAIKYKHPSEEILVIGITGTSGKSTTVYLLRQLLERAGYRVGSLSTIDFYIAGEHKLNDRKMTMLGKTEIQKYLRKMVDKRCDIAIIETTSEGAVQYRHRFINFDIMVLTNLYPEHIESHGSFENYKKAKMKLFEYIARSKKKVLRGKPVAKSIVINGCMQYAREFILFSVDRKYVYVRNDREIFVNKKIIDSEIDFVLGKNIYADKTGLHFTVGEMDFEASMYGEHNINNIIAVISVARVLDISWDLIREAVKHFKNVPGRVEFIPEAELNGFHAIVDYAFEPQAMHALYAVAHLLEPKRIIHVFGSTGGGRDKARRFTVGDFVGKQADICIITDEDPYDDDPMGIIENVAGAVSKAGKEEGKNMFKVLDRAEAVRMAVQMARKGDLILLTGKGSEQAMCLAGGRKIPWDDRKEIKKAIKERYT